MPSSNVGASSNAFTEPTTEAASGLISVTHSSSTLSSNIPPPPLNPSQSTLPSASTTDSLLQAEAVYRGDGDEVDDSEW